MLLVRTADPSNASRTLNNFGYIDATIEPAKSSPLDTLYPGSLTLPGAVLTLSRKGL